MAFKYSNYYTIREKDYINHTLCQDTINDNYRLSGFNSDPVFIIVSAESELCWWPNHVHKRIERIPEKEIMIIKPLDAQFKNGINILIVG